MATEDNAQGAQHAEVEPPPAERDLRILPECNLVYLRFAGSMSDEGLYQHVTVLNTELASHEAVLELADCRRLTDLSQLSVEGVVKAGQLEIDQPRAVGGRLAIVVANAVSYGMARAYCVVPQEIRAAVHVTFSIEEAIGWLGLQGDDAKRALELAESAEL